MNEILNEIDRLLSQLEQDPHLPDEDKGVDEGVKNVLEHLKGFIKRQKEGWIDVRDSLPDEDDFAKVSKISEDLEEAARNYRSAIYVVSPQWSGEVRAAFKAGAEWQKGQMMKDAVEGVIVQDLLGFLHSRSTDALDEKRFKYRDKVKIIIIKDGE